MIFLLKKRFNMQIIIYNDEYKQKLFEFTDRCFAELGKRFEPEGRHSFYNDIPNEFDVFFCMLEKDSVIGTAALKRFDGSEAELKALYLDKDYRGKGLGSELMNKVVLAAGELGYKSIVLDSMSQYKAARRLYEKTGFKDIARYNDNEYADVFMRMEL